VVGAFVFMWGLGAAITTYGFALALMLADPGEFGLFALLGLAVLLWNPPRRALLEDRARAASERPAEALA